MCARSMIVDNVAQLAAAGSSNLEKKQRLRKQKRKAMQQYNADKKNAKCSSDEPVPAIQQDILAISTVYYQLVVTAVFKLLAKCQETTLYRILFQTTQPAHLVALIAVSIVITVLRPFHNSVQTTDVPKHSIWAGVLYLIAFMTHFGAQIWMTFISGLSLYFAVPRHTFGEVQQVLFPRYFTLNSSLSLITLMIFLRLNPNSTCDPYLTFQVVTMVICFLLELTIRLYLAPPLLELIAAKNAIEKAAGVGLEIGKHDPGPLAQCPHYIKLHRTFRKVHIVIAIGNILSMVCTCVHIHYLAEKIAL